MGCYKKAFWSAFCENEKDPSKWGHSKLRFYASNLWSIICLKWIVWEISCSIRWSLRTGHSLCKRYLVQVLVDSQTCAEDHLYQSVSRLKTSCLSLQKVGRICSCVLHGLSAVWVKGNRQIIWTILSSLEENLTIHWFLRENKVFLKWTNCRCIW